MADFRFQVEDQVIVDRLATYAKQYDDPTNVVGTIRFRNRFGIGPELHVKGRWFKNLAVGALWYVVELPFGEFEDVPESHLSAFDPTIPILEPL